eukprot:2375444-Amphidinium_carterae.1
MACVFNPVSLSRSNVPQIGLDGLMGSAAGIHRTSERLGTLMHITAKAQSTITSACLFGLAGRIGSDGFDGTTYVFARFIMLGGSSPGG